MTEIKCTKCERVFYRRPPLNWSLECPSCHILLAEKETQYARERTPKEVLDVVGRAVQRKLGIHRSKRRRIVPLPIIEGEARPWLLGRVPRGHGYPIQVRSRRGAGKTLAHEIAHETAEGRLSSAQGLKAWRVKRKRGARKPQKVHHKKGFRKSKRTVLRLMKKLGAMKRLKGMGYGWDPKLQKPITKIYTDLGVTPPIGKGLHTPAFHRLAAKLMAGGMERNFAYATAMKQLGGKKAVNVKHQRQKMYALPSSTLEGRLASGVGRFVKRHAGLISLLVAAPAVANEIQNMIQKADQKRAAENYGLVSAGLGGRRAVVGKLVKRAKRKRQFRQRIMRFPTSHPKTMMVAGGAGLGAWGMKKAQQRQQQQQRYAEFPRLSGVGTGNARGTRTAGKVWGATKRIGKPVLKTGGQVALGGLISWIALSILQELERKRLPAIGPYMPTVVPDIEMARYTIGQVTEHVADIPTVQLYALKGRALKTLTTIKGLPHKAKVGAEKGLLMWLLGFISAEILGRGITTPKRRVRVEGEVPVRNVPYQMQSYKGGMQPHDPKMWAKENKAFEAGTRRIVKGVKRERRHTAVKHAARTVRRHPGKAAAVTLPWAALAGLVAARKIRQKRTPREQKYFAAGAAIGGAAKVAKLGKLATAGKWGNRALTAWIASDIIGAVIPRKKRKLQPGMAPMQSGPSRYAISRVPIRRLNELRWLLNTKVPIKGKRRAVSSGLVEIANRIKAERAVGAATIAGAGVGGYVAGKRLERRRIRKAVR